MKIKLFLFSFMLLAITAMTSCTENPSSSAEGANTIYYWRTTFSLSDAEKEFLHEHDVKKLYVRFFLMLIILMNQFTVRL